MASGGTSNPSPKAAGSPGGPQGAGTAPAPDTQAQKSATTPTQDCPLQVNKPCDVEKLEVTVLGLADDSSTAAKALQLMTRKVRRLDPVTDVKDRDVLRLLQQYDLIIDTLAEPDAPAIGDPTPAKVMATADYHGRHCSPQAHALVLMEDLYEKETIVKLDPGKASTAIPYQDYNALMSFIDRNPEGGEAFDAVSSVFGMIRALWDRTAERGISIDAKSCGIRARGDGTPKNGQLRALVRIYRKSKWAVGISIPPFGSFTDTKTGAMDVTGERSGSHTQSMSAGGNVFKKETSSEWSGEGTTGEYKHTQRTQLAGDVNAYESSRAVEDGSVTTTFKEEHSRADGREMVNQDGSFTSEDLKERLARATGFEFVISFNDTEVKLGEAIENIKEQINRIIEVIRNFQKLFDAMPKIGWSFSFDVSVFAGKISLEWASVYGPGALADGRYLPVVWDLHGRVDIEIINLTLKVGFGVDLRVLGTGVVAMIEGSLTLMASVGADINIGGDKLVEYIDVETSAVPALEAVASATVLGFTLVEAKLSVDGGIELQDGKLMVSWADKKFDLKGTLVSKEIQLNGYIRRRWWWDKKIDPPKVILEEKPLHEFS